MWLLRAATFAGQVGLTTVPDAVTGCSQKNLICGVASYGKYIRAADIQQHLFCVIEYLYDELGETFIDLWQFLVRTGSVLVVTDLAKYIGIALGCVAIDQTLRYLGILGDGRSRFIPCGRQPPEICATDSPALKDGSADVPVDEVETRVADVANRSSTSWTYVTTWEELTRNGTEHEHERKEGTVRECDQSEINEKSPCDGSSSRNTPVSENNSLRIFRKEGKPRRLIFVMDDLHLESSADNTSDTAREGALTPLTDVFLNRMKVVELQNDKNISPMQRASTQNQASNQPSTLHSAGHMAHICSYDADVSDEENAADSSPGIPGSERSHQTVEQHPGPLPVLRASTSSSRYETSNRNMKTERQPRLKASKGQWEGDYTSLKRLHNPRAFGRTGTEVVTQTSSEEFMGLGSGTSNQSSWTQTPLPQRRRRRGMSSEIHTSNERALTGSSDDAFDASSYILSSRSLSSKDCNAGPTSEFDTATDLVPLHTLHYWNAPHEGVQQFTFWQFPLSNTSVTKLLSCSNIGFPQRPYGSRSAQSYISSCNLLQQNGRPRSSQVPNGGHRNHQTVDVSSHLQQSKSQPHIPSSPRANIYRDLSSAQHEPTTGRPVQDMRWRVLLIHIVCWIIFGRHWRKFF